MESSKLCGVSMHLNLNIDLEHYQQRCLKFTTEWQSELPIQQLILEILGLPQGIQISELQVADRNGSQLDFSIEGTTISLNADHFTLTYKVQIDYNACLGAERGLELVYPFLNEHEIFMGTGILPYPPDLPLLAETMQIDCEISHLPTDWQIFSNIQGNQIHPAQLNAFFLYCSPDPDIHRFQHRDIPCQILIQREKTIPMSPQELWAFLDQQLELLEKEFVTFQHLSRLNVLILQAPPDFEALSGGRAFATGENMLNGIITYAPTDEAYLRKLGYSTYAEFLRDGLRHELLHFYTTTAWQGRYKSILYPASDCPPADAQLIGEALNVYLHRVSPLPLDEQLTYLKRVLQNVAANKRGLALELFLLDRYLQHHQSSLKTLFAAMLREKQQHRTPYPSIQFLFEVLENRLNLELPPNYRELLTGHSTSTYQALIYDALAAHGFTITDEYILVQTASSTK